MALMADSRLAYMVHARLQNSDFRGRKSYDLEKMVDVI
jgi:hypothetical protein